MNHCALSVSRYSTSIVVISLSYVIHAGNSTGAGGGAVDVEVEVEVEVGVFGFGPRFLGSFATSGSFASSRNGAGKYVAYFGVLTR